MLTRLISTLDQLGIDTSPENVSDLLWLAQYQDAWEFSAERDAANANARTASALSGKAEQPRSDADIDASANAATKNTNHLGTQSQSSVGANVLANAGGPSSGVPFNSPGVPALPGKLALSRAMRSLHRPVPSRTAKRIDEAATVAQVANSGIWMPVLRAAPERWLDVILLVDESASMVIWESTIREFKSLLEQQGAFRNVETWGLRTPTEGHPIKLHAGFGQAATHAPARDPRVLLDTTGQRLFLVVSDCVAPVWANGAAGELLQTWSKHNLVALVQVLPLHLWDRTAMREWAQLHVRATLAGTPNHQWEQRPIYEWLQEEEADAVSDANPFPIAAFTLEPHTLADWARCLVAGNGKWHRGYSLPTQNAAQLLEEAVELSEEATPSSASELVKQFIASASQEAIRLAGYLAAVPLTLPIMRMTQAVMLPHTRQVHLAEVFLSGLVHRITPQDQLGEPDRADDLEYDFVEGVRDIFTSQLPIPETLEVLQRVSEFVNQNVGQLIDFPALIADPTGMSKVVITQQNRRFAMVAAATLRRLGERYAPLAALLESALIKNLRNLDLSKLGSKNTVLEQEVF